MKITRDDSVFRPVVITLETKEETLAIQKALYFSASSNGIPYIVLPIALEIAQLLEQSLADSGDL